jgi:hypothetical protein
MNIEELQSRVSALIPEYWEEREQLNALFEQFRAQPLAVIVPPLEWGEWIYPNSVIPQKRSVCGKYIILKDPDTGGCDGFESDDDDVISEFGVTESEAIAACQAHKQETVNKALEGCNVVPYRDPQPLLDGYTKIMDIIADHASDEGLAKCFVKELGMGVVTTLKEWEANQ